MTLDMPFFELKSYPQVILALNSQRRPTRPRKAIVHGLTDSMWTLCNKCWSQNPTERPDTITLLEEVEALAADSQA